MSGQRGGGEARRRALRRLLLLAGLALAGCGGHAPPGDRVHGDTLVIYSGLPLGGASASGARAVLDGERLALEQAGGRVGRYTLDFQVLDDTSPRRGGWDPGQTTLNAHRAAADGRAIGYIGDFDSGASAVALPVLERAGIAQISPTGTAVGLTSAGVGAAPGEPDKYYPTGRRTFVRLAPDDRRQAAAAAQLQRSLGCRQVEVVDDGQFEGEAAAEAYAGAARSAGLTVLGTQAFDPRAPDYTGLAIAVAQTGADCLLISASPQQHAARLTRALAEAMPKAWVVGLDPLAQPTFVDPALGGVPVRIDARVLLIAPAPAVPAAGTGARAFTAAYRRRFGDPGPYGAYGYEAMRLLLDAISRATDRGRDSARRSSVIDAVMRSRARSGPLGAFTVNRDGSTTLSSYAVYRVVRGHLVLWYQASPRTS